jgi:hypothetical protein
VFGGMKSEHLEKFLWTTVQDRETKDTTQIKQQFTVLQSCVLCSILRNTFWYFTVTYRKAKAYFFYHHITLLDYVLLSVGLKRLVLEKKVLHLYFLLTLVQMPPHAVLICIFKI